MAGKLFGTDGIRGVAGEYPLDDATVVAAGRALGELVGPLGAKPQVLVGIDTRESGPRLAQLLAGGLARAGVKARFAGVVTTPAVAHLTQCGPFVAGAMISASHNPFQDNGIKVFAHSGFKLAGEQERQIEAAITRLRGGTVAAPPRDADRQLVEPYLDHLADCFRPANSPAARIVADCANGAACQIAPRLFQRLGLSAEFIANAPDGRNINLDCGSLHLDGLRRRVIEVGADLGVAFDGDADRALFISGAGRVVNGDAVLWMAARHFRVPIVVTTSMANLGLEKALKGAGIEVVRTPVGDKYVLEEMLRRQAELGGEQSGHIIFRRHATTGDGLLTALKVIEIMTAAGQTLDQLVQGLPVYPQTIRNVPVRVRTPLDQVPALAAAIRDAEQALAGRGRVVVRYSGTESLVRVMVEAESAQEVERYAGRLVAVVAEQLGA